MNKWLHQSKLFLHRNSSTILTCVGAVGTVATTVMAVKATPKALMLLEEAEREKGEDLTNFEIVKVAAPSYIPAALVGVSTLACIFGANALNKRQQAALMSAYAMLDNSYKEYKKKVEEVHGEGANAQIREELVKEKYVESDLPADDEQELFYDMYSDRYFHSTKVKVQTAEYYLNRNLAMRDYATVNDFYEYLGLEGIEGGDDIGWSPGAMLDMYWQNWIDFHHQYVELEDGLECYIIVMQQDPIMDFYDYC